MGIKVSNIKGESRKVTVEWEGETAEVSYRPSAVTVKALDAVQEHAEGDRGDRALVSMLEAVLVAWDVLGDDGEPIGTDADTLNGLPIAFLTTVLQAVQEDMNPGEAQAPSPAS